MDGVVADFNAYARKVLKHKEFDGHTWPEQEWRRLRDNPRLYRDLEKTSQADELVDVCKKFCLEKSYNLLFLTAVPKKNDVPWAFYDKFCWAQQYYPDIPVMFGPYSVDKQLHCVHGDILIDDRPANIQEWNSKGGVAIHYRDGHVDRVKSILESL
jgi:5'(3')-deoxyribonucleotidase